MGATYIQERLDLTPCHRKHIEAVTNSTHLLHQILLQIGMDDENSYDIATDLIHSFGSLRGVCFSSPEALTTIPGMTEQFAKILVMLPHLASHLFEENLCSKPKLCMESLLKTIWLESCQSGTAHFFVLYLNRFNKIIKKDKMFRGTGNIIRVYPREVVKDALLFQATHIVTALYSPNDPIESYYFREDIFDATDILRLGYKYHIDLTPQQIVIWKHDRYWDLGRTLTPDSINSSQLWEI